jgi:hypothetical protein
MNEGTILPPTPDAPTPVSPVEQPPEDTNVAQPAQPMNQPTQLTQPVAPEPILTEQVALTDSPDDNSITWVAAEFIAHQKTLQWYSSLAAVDVALAAITFLLTRDFISTAVIIICGILFGVYAGHQPRELEYSVDAAGLTIAAKRYLFDQFRSYSVIEDGAFVSISLMPLRRFSPGLTIYCDPGQEEAIMGILSEHLPLDDHTHDPVDRLMRRIRF